MFLRIENIQTFFCSSFLGKAVRKIKMKVEETISIRELLKGNYNIDFAERVEEQQKTKNCLVKLCDNSCRVRLLFNSYPGRICLCPPVGLCIGLTLK